VPPDPFPLGGLGLFTLPRLERYGTRLVGVSAQRAWRPRVCNLNAAGASDTSPSADPGAFLALDQRVMEGAGRVYLACMSRFDNAPNSSLAARRGRRGGR
jgi:hypothetical protein